MGIHPSFSEDEVRVKFTIKDIDDKVLEEWTENFSLTEGSILFSNDQELTSLFMKENTITGLDFLLMCDKVISALETNRDVLKLSSLRIPNPLCALARMIGMRKEPPPQDKQQLRTNTLFFFRKTFFY